MQVLAFDCVIMQKQKQLAPSRLKASFMNIKRFDDRDDLNSANKVLKTLKILTSFCLVPDDSLEGDTGAWFAGSEAIGLRDGANARSHAHVAHVHLETHQKSF